MQRVVSIGGLVDTEVMTLRTPETEARYREVLKTNTGRALADIPAHKEFRFWKIVPNDYPYDAVFSTHDLLLPKRVVKDRLHLRVVEAMELDRILIEQAPWYDCILENTLRKRSVFSHFHLHLLVYKKS
jgi:hypothetical protein